MVLSSRISTGEPCRALQTNERIHSFDVHVGKLIDMYNTRRPLGLYLYVMLYKKKK